MDWFLAGDAPPEAGSRLRREVHAYLERHARPGSDIEAAELVASELIQNGRAHTAGPLWVNLQWTRTSPVLSVTDLGPGFQLDPSLPSDPAATGGRGLHIVSRLAPDLTARVRAAGGAVVTATLPVTRVPARPVEAPRRHLGALPALEEAQPGGAFGRESFLRALAVQIAQTVERREGPDEADAVVAQVGADVGGQMELEYRQAFGLDGRLSPQQVADCYVRLKAAIGGGFRVEEVGDNRVVLVNDRCPFGDAVRHAPSLCGMTSTLFGSIAAANSESGAAVALEERIAVGDPVCRVVVWLDDAVADAPPFARSYPPPRT